MGCDIHAFVEYQPKKAPDNHWRPLGQELYLDRDYRMFGLLAGVRAELEPIVKPRGLPKFLSWASKDKALLRIDDTMGDREGWRTVATAERWKLEYGSKITYQDGEPFEVSNPDLHTHSWITTKEFAKVLSTYKEAENYLPSWDQDYRAILAAMKELEKADNTVRLVFWFDN